MIHLITKGGLGNQMFEYAFALRMRHAYNDESICINSLYHLIAGDKRKVSLQHFKLSEKTRFLPIISAFIILLHLFLTIVRSCGVSSFIRILRAKLLTSKADEAKLRTHDAYCAAGIYVLPEITPHSSWIKHAYGNFQDKNIINGIENELRSHFTVVQPPSEANKRQLEEIQKETAVCVHVRRGDYLHPQYAQLQVCNEQYYTEAIRQARLLIKNPVFYIFSTGHEDIEWIRQNYHFDADVRYVDLDNPDYEELRLMTACQHFIISNSTFSWWAAVLSNASPDKKVWCPSIWIKGSSVSLALDSWNLI